MPAEEELKLGPDKLGLSLKDCMYLIIFRELKSGAEYLTPMYEVVNKELDQFVDRGHSKRNFYNAAADMEQFGWITLVGTDGKKKKYGLSPTGVEKMDWFHQTYYESLSKVKAMADYFAYLITGTGNKQIPVLTDDQLKLFNRLISVRHITRYLFMKILYQEKSLAAIDIWRKMQEKFHWRCGEGYVYELAHEMQRDLRWIAGTWVDKDGIPSEIRIRLVYRMTSDGDHSYPREEEAALHYIRNLQGYTRLMIRLFEGNLVGSPKR